MSVFASGGKNGKMSTSDGVHTLRLHFQERNGKDQKKTQTQTLRVKGPLGSVHTTFRECEYRYDVANQVLNELVIECVN